MLRIVSLMLFSPIYIFIIIIIGGERNVENSIINLLRAFIFFSIVIFTSNKNYYMNLLSFRFSNVFANVKNPLIISPNNSWIINDVNIPQYNIISPALLSLENIYQLVINYLKNYITENQTFTISINNYGKCEIVTNGFSSISIPINNSILATDFMGNFTNGIFTNGVHISPNMPSVSDFNSVILLCSLCSNSSYIQDNEGRLSTINAIASVSAQSNPFETRSFNAIQPIRYPINSSTTINGFIVEMKDDNNNELIQLNDSKTDFNIWFEILEE